MDEKVTKYVQKILIFGLCIGILLLFSISAKADMLNIPNVNGMPSYAGHLVGPIGANLNSSAISGGITCLDINTTTYVPATFEVHVGTLSPVDLSKAKFGSDAAALFKYQEAAWLLGQMANNPAQTGPISFAIWRLFTPSASSGASGDLTAENSWMSQAAQINPQLYDFSSVKIYTATNTVNQEFMSGKASPVPIPAGAWLLCSGLAGIVMLRRRYAN
jgi:hypothetical protein